MSEQDETKPLAEVSAEMLAGLAATQLEKRLEAARFRKQLAAARRDKAADDRAELDLVEAEERDAADEEAIANAEEAWGGPKKIAVIRTTTGCVIVRRPKPAIYKRFRDVGKTKTVDLEKLVRSCLVYPDGNALDKIFDEEAGTLDRAANAVVELAGFRTEEVSGK